ncbi:MAG TPA: tyrosine-type recombinase/integrase [Geothrix sp.]|nr:tyrosine-type recombinase/integrase [Geothrix sp.]
MRNPSRPKPSKPFNFLQLKNWTIPGTYGEGGGLYFQVKQLRTKKDANGQSELLWDANKAGEKVPRVSKAWIFRYRDKRTGKLQDMGLGSFKTVSLSKARELAEVQRDLLLEFKDPLEHREAILKSQKQEKARAVIFSDAARQFWNTHKASWGEKHTADWINSIEIHVNPKIGNMVVSEIEMEHVWEILNPLWRTSSETAGRIRSRIENVWDFCKGKRWVTGDNPASWKGNLDTQLPPLKKIRVEKHQPALHHSEIGVFTNSLREQGGPAARALEFLILTAVRTSDVTKATWKEFDLDKALWTIRDRIKGEKNQEKTHVVPLSPRAVEILKSMGDDRTPDAYVFPGEKPGQPGSNGYLPSVIRRMNEGREAAGLAKWTDPNDGRGIVVHGFRACFRTWAQEGRFDKQTVEFALAHRLPDKVEEAYARGTMIDQRRPLMESWARFCNKIPSDEPASNVVDLLDGMIPAMAPVKAK